MPPLRCLGFTAKGRGIPVEEPAAGAKVEQQRQSRKWGKDLGCPGDNRPDDLTAVVVVMVVLALPLPASHRVPEGMSNEYLFHLSWGVR